MKLANHFMDGAARVLPQAANRAAGLPTLGALDRLDMRAGGLRCRPPDGDSLVGAISSARLGVARLTLFTLGSRRRFALRSIAIVLGTLDTAATTVRRIVAILKAMSTGLPALARRTRRRNLRIAATSETPNVTISVRLCR